MDFINSLYGAFLGSTVGWYITLSAIVLLTLGFIGARLLVWTITVAAILVGFQTPSTVLWIFAVLAVIFNIFPLRQLLVSKPLMGLMKGFMPKISETERTALEAGVVWVEKDLFSGKPDLKKMLQEPYPTLTDEENKFIDGPVNELCESLNDWEIWQNKDISSESWDIIK